MEKRAPFVRNNAATAARAARGWWLWIASLVLPADIACPIRTLGVGKGRGSECPPARSTLGRDGRHSFLLEHNPVDSP